MYPRASTTWIDSNQRKFRRLDRVEDTVAILQLIAGIFAAFVLMAVFNAISDHIEARWSRRKYVICLSGSFVVFSALAGGLYCWVGETFWDDGAVRYVVLMFAFFAFFSLLEMVDHDRR